MGEPVSYVIGIHENGEFSSYANDSGEDVGYDEHEAQWYETRAEAVEALGDVPRKVDARIYELVLSPDSSPVRSVVPTAQVVKNPNMIGEIEAADA